MYLVVIMAVNHCIHHYLIIEKDTLRAHLNCRASAIMGETGDGTFTCVQTEEGVGCAMAKWKLCGGNLRWLDFGAVHSHACIICPFSLNGTPCPLSCLTTLDPLSTTLLIIRQKTGI